MSPAQVSRVRRYRSATQSKRWGSFGASLFLHLGLVFTILFAPSGKPVKIDLDSPIMTLTQVTIGAAGPKATAPPPAAPKPAPAPPPPAPAATAEAVPVPKIEEVQKQAEDPPKPKPAKEAPKEPEKTGPTDEELLTAALAGAQTDAKSPPKVSGGQSILDAALSSAGTDAKAEKTVTGEGGDGIGIVGTYADSIISRVRPHFTIRPHTDSRVYVVVVLLEIAEDGNLLKATVKAPSGDPLLDANVLRAIREAGKFEPPPSRDLRKMEIPFTSDIYAGQ